VFQQPAERDPIRSPVRRERIGIYWFESVRLGGSPGTMAAKGTER
jgi:hypothetical protein